MKDNVNALCRFFFKFNRLITTKGSHTKIKYGIKTKKEYYKQIQNECEDFVSHDVEVIFEKKLKNLDVTETSRVN